MDAELPLTNWADRRSRRVDASLSGLLIVQTLILFVAIPLGASHPAAHMLLDGCHLAFAAVCVAVLTSNRVLQAALLAGLALLALGPIVGERESLRLGIDTAFVHDLIALTAFGFNALVTGIVAGHVFGPGRVTAHRVQGAVLLYLNVAALFSIAYGVLLAHVPGAIAPTGDAALAPTARSTAELTYFSIATITTTGYGDLVPIHPLARSLANAEAVFGQLFPATILARLVGLRLAHAARDRDG